jgi:PAS domain S-box-containing protein
MTEAVTALISKSLNGRITTWNDGAEILFGYSAAEAIGKHISIIIPFDFQDEEYELLDRLKAEGVVEARKTVRRTKDGKFLLALLSATPIRDETGKIVGALKKVQKVQDIASPHLPSSPAA